MGKDKNKGKRADTVVVLDFETSGMSPVYGDRPIEIGAVKLEKGVVTGQFQELMNPGFRIDGFIESYTGITNAMIRKAPPCEDVMARFADFIDGFDLVAHNASFDRRFLDYELDMIGQGYTGRFACSMLAARRIYQDAPDHKLGTLVRFLCLDTDGTFHRALADSIMTAQLWMTMLTHIQDRYAFDVPAFSLMQKVTRTAKTRVDKLFKE